MSEAIVPLSSIDAAEIRERVRAAGVVGAGGAGFPTHIKLQARVDTVLVNAAECEPMLKVDQQLMAQQADRLIRGLGYAMTATGAVARPLTLAVPLGISLREVLDLAGGATVDDPGFINGGPMMGSLITSLETPVTKTTGGLLVLPGNHPLIQRRRQDERTLLAIARTVCEQCRLCTDLCPRHLIGHELSPHLLVRAVNYRQAATPSLLLSALTCSECNVCESVACPVGISPMRINRLLKRELRAKNLRYDGPLRPADEMAKHRLVPVKRLISKLGLDPWYQEAPLTAVEPEVACVTLPLRQHIGISAVPCVAPGERVTRGQVLADIPADALGAPVHASIDGLVSAITEQAITLVRG
ncbi:TPA: SLBB domain-containing protein [Klebsiella pneumoniae]|nr:SLBB domain-containing protein [Klebsiella pneumoniae]HBZ7639027.1 SLBB domain-containing protein [Klebsiella pneumoniae]